MPSRRRSQEPDTGPTMDVAAAIAALSRQKARGLELAENSDETAREVWFNTTRAILVAAFGSGSHNISAVMSAGPGFQIFPSGTPPYVFEQRAKTKIRAAATLLDSCIEQLEVLAPASASAPPNVARAAPDPTGTLVFIVHGTNEGLKEAVARFLQNLGLDSIILHEQPNRGRTLIEKFEEHANVSFAVVILTGDDSGGPTGSASQRLRGRQNVVFELGYFIGRLGRKRVCTLYEDGVEIPSDFNGIVYVPIDAAGAWRMLLARELKAAGFEIDMNRAIS